MKVGAVHPHRDKQREDAKQRLSFKYNKKVMSKEIVVDDSDRRARYRAHKAKLDEDRKQRYQEAEEEFAKKQKELIEAGARMNGAGNMKTGIGAWLERRRRKSLILMPEYTDPWRTVEMLGLTQRDLRKLKMVFEAIDCTGDGHIDMKEFFEALNDDRGGFKRSLLSDMTRYLFNLIDLDGNGTVEYDELVHLCGTFGIYSKIEMGRFVFDCFDKDGSEHLDEEEFANLVKELDPEPMFPGSYEVALREFDANKDGLIDWGEFKVIWARYPSMFFPVFHLQNRIHQVTLGERRWVEILTYYNDKRRAVDWLMQHQGVPPPLGACAVCRMTMFCRRHPVEYLLGLNSRRQGFEDEPDSAHQRLYLACIDKYGFQKPRKVGANPGRAEKKEAPLLGYAEWRAAAGQRASMRAKKAADGAKASSSDSDEG
eukprot:g1200.t1